MSAKKKGPLFPIRKNGPLVYFLFAMSAKKDKIIQFYFGN